LLIGFLFIVIAGVRSRRTSFIWTFCEGLILSVILVPAAEQYHYVLLFPAFLLAAHSPTVPRPLLYVAAILIALPLSYTDKALSAGWWALLAYPRLYGAIFLFVILLFDEDEPPSRKSEVLNIDAFSRAK